MGGIACVTPPEIVETSPIIRTVKLTSTETVGAFGQISIKTYSKPAVPGLRSVLELALCPSWSGFMKVAMQSYLYETTRIETLPFINLDSSNTSTIYTGLCFAQKQCEKHGLKICPVTYRYVQLCFTTTGQ